MSVISPAGGVVVGAGLPDGDGGVVGEVVGSFHPRHPMPEGKTDKWTKMIRAMREGCNSFFICVVTMNALM
jgi:hypothetical protein